MTAPASTICCQGCGYLADPADPCPFRCPRAGTDDADHVLTRVLSPDGAGFPSGPDDLLETTLADRNRIFNLGYYTWVEQQGVSLTDFEARRDQRFWAGLRDLLPAWDAMIAEFNERTGLAAG